MGECIITPTPLKSIFSPSLPYANIYCLPYFLPNFLGPLFVFILAFSPYITHHFSFFIFFHFFLVAFSYFLICIHVICKPVLSTEKPYIPISRMGIFPVLAVPPACSMMKAMGKHSYSTRSFPFGESAATDKETVLQQLQLQSSTQRVKFTRPKNISS